MFIVRKNISALC